MEIDLVRQMITMAIQPIKMRVRKVPDCMKELS
jgi:hypothetical protein